MNALEKYLKLQEFLVFVKELSCDEDLQDDTVCNIESIMDEVWWRLTEEEQEKINTDTK